MSKKKKEQLGMNPGTASNRLVKDLLFNFILANGHKCHQCGGDLERENFSIEHIVPWLDSDKPKELYFDIDNIAYSHLKCNIKARRKDMREICHPCTAAYQRGCRCKECTNLKREQLQRYRASIKR